MSKKKRVNLTIDSDLLDKYRSLIKGNLSAFLEDKLSDVIWKYETYNELLSKDTLTEGEQKVLLALIRSIGYASLSEEPGRLNLDTLQD